MERAAALLAIAFLAAGCPDSGTDDTQTPGHADAGVSADAGMNTAMNASALAAAVCARQAACCPGNTETEANCKSSIERTFAPAFTLAGIAVDSAAIARCAEHINAMSCDEAANYAGRPPIGRVCERFYHGTLAIGATCGGATILEKFFEDDQCESGACAMGKCVARPNTGESCTDAPCKDGLQCFQGQCIEPKQLNEDCSQLGFCAEPNACFGSPMTCQAPRSINPGEECAVDGRCSLGDEECYCPLGQEGCGIGSCGNRSRCLAR